MKNHSDAYRLLNETLQRAVIILFLSCIPLSILWVNGYHIMVALGQSKEIARLSSQYLLYLIPGLFSYSYATCLSGWLHAQQLTTAPAIIGIIVSIFHPMWCYIMIYTLNMGFIGGAVAMSCTRFFEGF